VRSYSFVNKDFLVSQVAALNGMANTALLETQQITALNVAAIRAEANNAIVTSQKLIDFWHPQLFNDTGSHAQSVTGRVLEYLHDLATIVSTARAAFSQQVEEYVLELHGNTRKLLDTMANNAPVVESSSTAPLLQSTVANAITTFDQINNLTQHAVAALEVHCAILSDQMEEAVSVVSDK